MQKRISRADVFRKLVRLVAHDYGVRVARAHVVDGFPPISVFAFDHVGIATNLFGRYEREELDILLAWLDARGRLDGVCIDIGAHIGTHSLALSPRFAKVLAFEPNPRTFKLLEFNAALVRNITCFNVGLSDRAGTASLTTGTSNTGRSMLLAEGAHSAMTTVEVPLVTLDALPELKNERVGFIKLDAENHEASVLRGAREIIKRDRPIIAFEQLAEEFDDEEASALGILRGFGYTRFLTIEKTPRFSSATITALARLVCGETIALRETTEIEPRSHAIIVAVGD